jgi:hypothetical protein
VAKARTFGATRPSQEVEPGKVMVTIDSNNEIVEVHWKANPGENDGLGNLIERLIDIHPQRKELIQRLISE